MQVDPEIITTIINKITEEVSDEEIDKLVAFFREERKIVFANEAKKPRSTLNKAAAKIELDKISTDDLEL